jgi:putative hydrolase of the HAD superfamily
VIRGIIFDCFGVLYQGSLTHLAELADPNDRQAVHDLAHASDYGYIGYDEYFEQLGALVHKPAADVQAIVRERHVRNTELVALVHQLRGRYKVGMLSNVGRGVMTTLFSETELGELFDAVVLSSDVGLIKPDPHIYEVAAAQLGYDPDACVMIDDLPSNIDGAERAGMQGIVYSSVSQLKIDLAQLLIEA